MSLPLRGAGLSGSTAAVATATFTDSSVNGTPATNFTFSTQSIGTAAANRKVVVVVQLGTAGQTVSSLTIGGNGAASIVARSASEHVSIWQLVVASGTTADVVVNGSGVSDACGIGVYAVYGAAAAATDTGGSTAVDPATDTIDVPAGGVLIAGVVHRSGAETFAWTNITERYDELIISGVLYQSGASSEFASAQTGLAITADPSTAGSRAPVFAMASWAAA